jgi:hypothetical protein
MSNATFSSTFALNGNYFYITRRYQIGTAIIHEAGRWNGTTANFERIGNANFSNGSSFTPGLAIIPVNENKIYLAGSFTNYVSYYNGTNWTSIGPGNFTASVTDLAWDNTNQLLYAVSHSTSTIANRIAVYNGSSWTSLGGKTNAPTISTYGYIDIDPTTGNLYLAFSSSLFRYNKLADNWTNIGSIGNSRDLKYNALTHSIFIGSSTLIRYYDIANNTISSLPSVTTQTSGVYAVDFDNTGRLYIACSTKSTSDFINSIMYYNAATPITAGGSWISIYNFSNTSGVLEIVIDTNKNIFAFPNSGTLVLGTYQGSNTWSWASYAQNTSTITITGQASGGFESGSGSGDPHITTIFGTNYFLASKKYFRLFDNNNIENRFFVNAKCSKGKYPSWRSKEYISTLYFQFGKEYIIVNVGFRGTIPFIDKTNFINDSKFTITQNNLPMNSDIISFCSNCKFKSYIEKDIIEHINCTNHTIIENIRGQICICVNIENIDKKIIFTIENVNECNFEPAKVSVSNIDFINNNITKYSGAIIRKLSDYSYDVSCLYDDNFIFNI